jgi:hypothetical protein
VFNPGGVLDGSNESLSVNVGMSGLLSSYNPTMGALALTGSASIATYETVLETLTYNDVAGSPNTTTRDIQVTVTDANSPQLKSNVAVASVSFNGTYTEAGGPASATSPTVVIDANDVISDPKSPTLVSATMAISSG